MRKRFCGWRQRRRKNGDNMYKQRLWQIIVFASTLVGCAGNQVCSSTAVTTTGDATSYVHCVNYPDPAGALMLSILGLFVGLGLMVWIISSGIEDHYR